MIPIARGQAIIVRGYPMVHACQHDDAELDSGDLVIVAFCYVWGSPGEVEETDEDIDCMMCLGDPEHQRGRE